MYSTLSILLGVENYAIWLSRIKNVIARVDADHLIFTVAIFAEDEKLEVRAIGLVISKFGGDPLQVIHGIETLKGILGLLSEQYAEKSWGSKQPADESLRHVRFEDCDTTVDYVTRFCHAVHRLRNLGQGLNNGLSVFELIGKLGSEHLVWSTSRERQRNHLRGRKYVQNY